MNSQSARFDNVVVIDCAPLCGDRLPPSSRVAYFGKTKLEIEGALSRAQDEYNARFKLRTFRGLSGALSLVGFVLIFPFLLMFFGGILINILAAIGVPVPSFNELSKDNPLAEKAVTWGFLASIPIIALAMRLQAKASTVLAHDPRPPVLLLRSFADEARAPMARDSFGVVTLLEEKLKRAVIGLGPFVAIGLPGEKIAYRGAGRAYYSEAEWREAVLKFMETSRLIVLVAGESPALVWELEQIVVRNYLGRTVIVLPPDEDAGICARRWQVLERLLPPLARANPGSAERAAAIYHAGDTTVLVGSSVNINVSDYGDMMRAPLYDLFCVGRH